MGIRGIVKAPIGALLARTLLLSRSVNPSTKPNLWACYRLVQYFAHADLAVKSFSFRCGINGAGEDVLLVNAGIIVLKAFKKVLIGQVQSALCVIPILCRGLLTSWVH